MHDFHGDMEFPQNRTHQSGTVLEINFFMMKQARLPSGLVSASGL